MAEEIQHKAMNMRWSGDKQKIFSHIKNVLQKFFIWFYHSNKTSRGLGWMIPKICCLFLTAAENEVDVLMKLIGREQRNMHRTILLWHCIAPRFTCVWALWSFLVPLSQEICLISKRFNDSNKSDKTDGTTNVWGTSSPARNFQLGKDVLNHV